MVSDSADDGAKQAKLAPFLEANLEAKYERDEEGAKIICPGFRLEPLLKPGWNVDDFTVAWHPKFTDQVRRIRNALVHGREQRMANVIAPTSANDDKLRPWLAPLSVVAEQTILCQNI